MEEDADKHQDEETEPESEETEKMKFPFKNEKQKTNLPETYPKEINEFISSVRSELIGSQNKSRH